MIHSADYTYDLSKLIPEGGSGNFSITTKVIPKGKQIQTYSPSGVVYYDKLQKDFPMVLLRRGSDILMSDSPFEQESMRVPTILARKKVLVLGLGIGLYPLWLKERNNRVESVTIVERAADVFALVFPHVKSSLHARTSIVIADGWDFMGTTHEKYDFVFIDIWGSQMAAVIEGPAWAEQAKLCLAPGGSVRFWMQEIHARVATVLENIVPSEGVGFEMRIPCFMCAKTLRNDFGGLCLDCADQLGVSEMFVKKDG